LNPKRAAWVGAVILSLLLSGCAYQGWTRYECQKYENWDIAECNPPECKATGVCTEDIFGYDPREAQPLNK
jgi:hypothetical protein